MTRLRVSLLPCAGLLWLACSQAAQSASAVDTSVSSHQQLIAELQARQPGTAANAELGEAYYGLGSALQAEGRHEEAMAAFDMALQALRQNQGLYELEQLPVLQARLDSSQALESWEEVDSGRHLAYLITLRNPDAGTEHRYQALRELGLWKLRAAEGELLPDSYGGVRDAAALYRHELEQPGLRASYQGRPLSLANLYLDLAALEFLQARKKLAQPLNEYVTGQPRTVTEMQCQTLQTPDGRTRQVCRSLQVPNLDYFLSLSDRKYEDIRLHLDAMQESVLEAYDVLIGEVATPNRADALALLSEVHRLTDAYNNFVAENARRTESRIAAPTGSILRR